MLKTTLVFVLTIFLCCIRVTNAQGIADNWILGQGGLNPVPYGGGMTIKFINDSLSITKKIRKMSLFDGNASISDNKGKLLFYTNGCWIADANNDTMLNGSRLHQGYGGVFPPWNPCSQSVLIIPFPGDTNKFILFHYWTDTNNQHADVPEKGYYTIIDMSQHAGLGSVISKNNIAFNDTLAESGLFAACKHANGRDWWVIAPTYRTNSYQVLLVTPNGITHLPDQSIGTPPSGWYQGYAQCAFSPDGKKYARFDGIDFLNIYDFDRCSGLFSNPVHISFPDTMYAGGLAFSPNSSKLYISDWNLVYQFDVTVSNIAASMDTVAIYDGFYDSLPQRQTTFFRQQLGPDGKIYLSTCSASGYLHVINYPDSSGLACDFRQHALHLKAIQNPTLPHYPNYYLGVDSGSVCDTLSSGLMQLQSIKNGIHLSIYPNPIQKNQELILRLSQPFKQAGKIFISDECGKLIYSTRLAPWTTLHTLNLNTLCKGIYFVDIACGQNKVSGKFTVVH